MLDPNVLRNRIDDVKTLIANGRGNAQKANLDRWLELDTERTTLRAQLEQLNQQKNQIAELGKQGKIEEARAEGQKVREASKEIEAKLTAVDAEWQEIMDWVPNLPLHAEDMPTGKSEDDNIVIKQWIPGQGYITDANGKNAPETDHLMPQTVIHAVNTVEPMHHIDLGEKLGIIDTKQSALVSGTRFTYLLGDAALLQYAIQQIMFAELLKRGFKLVIPPILVKDRAVYGTSHLPEGKDQIYKIDAQYTEEDQQLNLLGSSEPTNFAYFMDKTLDHSELPIKLFAYTPCFRSEVGSWGRDTKGIKRVHQFDKIEMNVVALPEQSEKIFDELMEINEWLLQKLELPYRLVQKCTADAGYLASAKQVDAEYWLSGQRQFMEFGTDTNTTDYQARRLNIRFKNDDGSKEYVHTINDTGVAMGRMIIAIMDNYQQADGSIKVPTVLVPLMGKEYIR